MTTSLCLSVHAEEWATKIPFRITGRSVNAFEVIAVEINDGRCRGRGEAHPVFYLHESLKSVLQQIEAAAAAVESGIDRRTLMSLMPPGAARNAIDSAMWDLEAKRSGRSIWELTGIVPKPVTTAFTIGIEDTPEMMASRALEAKKFQVLKIKVNEDRPAERVAAIRSVRPDATLVVDANQGWTFEQLIEVLPKLAAMGVSLIEQPLPRGRDDSLEGFRSPIPLCADESCQHQGELDKVSRRYQIVNIKLDKAGGLTEALLIARSARDLGLDILVSNMGGTSLSMAPAFVLAQLCKYVELDGHLLLKHDCFPSLLCEEGRIAALDARLWG